MTYSSWQEDKDHYWEDEHDPYDHDGIDAQFDKQFNDGMARGEALSHISELEPWRRGAQGKGLIMHDGTVHTWNDPLIHHQQVAQLVGPRNVNTFIDQIHEDGSAAMQSYHPTFQQTLKPHGIRPYDMWAEQHENDFTF